MEFSIISELFDTWFSKEMASRVLDIAILLLIGLAVQQVLLIISGRLRKKLEKEGSGASNVRVARARTVTNVLFTTISIAGWIVIILLVLDRIGVNITPLLASAGVLGLAISFGSQELVRDFIAGFFFLLENQFNTGDIIEVKGKKGKVIDMSLRTVTLKDEESGTVHIYRNSMVDMVTRFSPHTEDKITDKNSK